MMRKKRILLSLVFSIGAGWALIEYVAYPVLLQSPRISSVMTRYDYPKEVLMVFTIISLWSFCLQLEFRRLNVIFLYLFYSVYLLLLFVVLFTKAPEYRALSLDLFDFFVLDKKVLLEAFLNVFYFIPLGGLYALKATHFEFIVIALSTILGIETIQYVFYIGTFALSDILLNFIGCMIGYYLARILMEYYFKKPRNHKSKSLVKQQGNKEIN